jgi:thiol-disulfide isomerase/thioredoxin
MLFMIYMKNINPGGCFWGVRLIGASLLSAALFSAAQTDANAGTPAPWAVTSPQGRQISSASVVGKVTIVNFWATYCIPCIVEMPTLRDLAQKYQKNGLSVVGVSVDAHSTAMIQAFADKFKTGYPMAVANPGVLNSFGVSDTVPMTFILDQQGRVVRKHSGYVKKEDLEKDVRTLLKL